MIVELIRQLKNGNWLCIDSDGNCASVTHEELDIMRNPAGSDGFKVNLFDLSLWGGFILVLAVLIYIPLTDKSCRYGECVWGEPVLESVDLDDSGRKALFAATSMPKYIQHCLKPGCRGWQEPLIADGLPPIPYTIQALAAVKNLTSYGDVVIVCDKSLSHLDTFLAYYASRSVSFAGNMQELGGEMRRLDEYRKTWFAKHPNTPGGKDMHKLKIYLLAHRRAHGPLCVILERMYPYNELPYGWLLFNAG